MSESSLFKNDIHSYTPHREKPTSAYVRKMTDYLQRKYPDASNDTIIAFVRNQVIKNIKRPKVKLLTHPVYGTTVEREGDLLTILEDYKTDIITPSGAIYMPPSEKKSVIASMIESKIVERNLYKGEMLEALSMGDSVRAIVAKNLQASAKIFNNSIPGAMGTIYSFLFDLPGYNAITSVGQQGAKLAYAHAERMLCANMYLSTVDAVINFIHTLSSKTPSDKVDAVIKMYNLHIPTCEEVTNDLLECLKFYQNTESCFDPIFECVKTLTVQERCYLTYAYCYWNFLKYNNTFMRKFFSKFFDRNVFIDKTWDPKDIFKVEGDLLNMAMSINFELIHHVDIDGKNSSNLGSAIDIVPEGVLNLLAICRHMQNCLTNMTSLFTTFFKVDYTFPDVWSHPKIVRKCVAVSDTDSVIFQTSDIVRWYTPEKHFCQKAYDINAFSVYMISQTLEHVFARLATAFGAEGNDRKLIKMKNEYYFPIFIRTTKGKHYLGQIRIQEGKILPKPERDIKGVVFRGSDLPADVGKRFEKYFDWICDTLTTGDEKISVNDLLSSVVEFELHMFKSLSEGKKEYLPTAQVRVESEYPNPIRTNYFAYMLWEEVFQDTFGEFVIPNKGYTIPLISNKVLTNPEWQDKLSKVDPTLPQKLNTFIAKYPYRKINSIILPPSLLEVPEIFRPIMDIRKLIFTCTRSFALCLNQFGLSFNDTKTKYLISDFISDSGMNAKDTKKS
jgi:hypothetical protein